MLGGAKSNELKKLKKGGVGFNPDPTGLASRLACTTAKNVISDTLPLCKYKTIKI
jgi:hypothetical protein